MHNSMVSIAPVEELQTNPSVNCTGYLVLQLDLNYISSFNFTKHEQKVINNHEPRPPSKEERT